MRVRNRIRIRTRQQPAFASRFQKRCLAEWYWAKTSTWMSESSF